MLSFFGILITFSAGVSAFLAYKKVNSKKTVSLDENYKDFIAFQIKLPKSDALDATAVSSERLFASLHGLLSSIENKNSKIIFNIIGTKEGVKFYCLCLENSKSFIQSQLYAHFPQIQISDVNDFYSLFNKEYQYQLKTLAFSKKNFFPIKTFKDFDFDPLNQTTEVLSKSGETGVCAISYTISPINDGWQTDGYEYISELKGDTKTSFLSSIVKSLLTGFTTFLFPPVTNPSSKAVSSKKELNSIEQDHIANIESKLSKMGFSVSAKVLFGGKDSTNFSSIANSVLATYRQYSDTAFNQFQFSSSILDNDTALNTFLSSSISDESLILNTEELAGLIHFSGVGVVTPFVERSLSKKSEPPLNLPIDGDVNIFGTTNFREKQVNFGIKNNNKDRLRHMYFVGKTGVGKSTLFENMIIQDIIAGRGCGYIDPHGDTIDKILRRIPKERIEDVVLIDLSDTNNPVGINVLELTNPEQKNLLASSVLTAFKLQFGNISWGPRLEYLLNYAILTLVAIDGTTLLSITRLLSDKNYRKFILEKVTDPVVLRFWNNEFPQLEKTFDSEAISPIQNKVNRFLSSTTLRNVVGQRNSTIDFGDIMDNKKILLIKLSKGLIGDDNAYLLGSFIVNRINFFAMQRARMREEERVPFYLFVDEFQNFASESFVSILSEARKYGLSLHLTHQYTAQLPPTIKDAILGNVGSIVAFTLGSQDAKELGFEFAPVFDENDLITQEVFNFYVKLQIDGSQCRPFSGKSLAPIYSSDDYTQEIIEASRKKYGKSREYVENKVKIWIERPFDVGMAIAQRFKDTRDERLETR